MTETEKIRIRQLDDKSDYALWRIRIFAAISAKSLETVFETRKQGEASSSTSTTSPASETQCQQASNIIVSALGDHALRVVRTVIGNPKEMMEKLDARYDSKTIASRISKMSELVSIRYNSIREDMDKHIDKLAGIIEQLRSMGSTFDDALAIGILVASITVSELMPATAAIKTLADKDIKWEEVSSRLIEEVKNIKSSNRTPRANSANSTCAICGKNNHSTNRCFLNPMNPHNKLDLKNGVAEKSQDGKTDDNTDKKEKSDTKKEKKKKKKKERAGMARTTARNRSDKLMLDSGTTSHITPDVTTVKDSISTNISIKLADDSNMQATAKGTRSLNWKTHEGERVLHLSNTLVAPQAAMSLLSIPSLVNKNIAVLFLPGKALFIDLEDNNSILGYGTQDEDGLFYVEDNQEQVPVFDSSQGPSNTSMMAIIKDHGPFEIDTDDEQETDESSKSDESSDTEDKKMSRKQAKINSQRWHNRLGHAKSVKEISKLVRNGQLPHISCRKIDCEDCAKGKYRRKFQGSLTKEAEVGRLHVDTKGKVDTPSVNGHLFFLTIVDEYSRFTQTYPMKSKGEASELLLNFIKKFEKQSNRVVKKIHSDNGTEFSRAFDILKKDGLEITTSTAYTPESNGLVERTHGVLLSSIRSCLQKAKLPMTYWNYALRHVTDSRNVLPVSGTGKTPYEIVFGVPSPNVRHMRPFGCRVEFRPNVKRIEVFESRVQEGIHLFHEGGGVYNIQTADETIRTKHVTFREDDYPGDPAMNFETTDSSSSYTSDSSEEYSVDDTSSEEETIDSSSDSTEESEQDTVESEEESEDQFDTDNEESDQDDDVSNKVESDEENIEEDVGNNTRIEDLTYTPAEPSNYHVTPVQSDDESDANHDRNENSGYGLRPLRRVDYSMAALPDAISTSDEPSLTAAMKSAEKDFWQKAITEEIETLIENETWTPNEKPPPNIKVLPSMIILKLKRDNVGRPARFKARVVALGNYQDEFGNEIELYAPVVCIELVRALFAVMLIKGWTVKHLDIKGAFLHAYLDIEDEIWLKLPVIPGNTFLSGRIVRLLKSLYGLRQAPKLWYKYLFEKLKKLGFIRSSTSDCLFLLSARDDVVLLVYVDDVLLFGLGEDVERVSKRLSEIFTVTDLGRCSHFLGVKVDYRNDGVFMSQSAYVHKIIETANMSNAKFTKNPLPLSHTLYEEVIDVSPSEAAEMEEIPFRKVLGALLFLSTRTRPDISTAVSMIAKFQSNPRPIHWKMLKNVVRYLIGTTEYGILLPTRSSNKAEILCWADADWARDLSKRRSRTGFLVTINGGPIIWTSKLQSCTAQSTAEAEFNALSHAIREVKWLRMVLKELKVIDNEPTQVLQDNLGSISWTEEVNGLRKVKHVGIKYHFVRENVDSKVISIMFTPSSDNRSDSLTKVLIGSEFEKHRTWLGVTN